MSLGGPLDPNPRILEGKQAGRQGLILSSAVWDKVRDHESPVEVFGWDQQQATRMVRIDYSTDNLRDAVWQILGYSEYIQDAALNPSRKFKRYLPECHPRFPNMVATKISRAQGQGIVTPAGTTQYDTIGKDRIAKYKYAWLTVDYETPDYTIKPDSEISSEAERFVSWKIKPTGELLSFPIGSFLWAGGSQATARASGGFQGKILATADFTYTWHQVPFNGLPYASIYATLGKVNNATFFGCDPWTLLLTSVDLKRIRTPYGTWNWQVEYTMKYAPHKHNYFYNFFDTTPGFYEINKNGAAITPGHADAQSKTPYADATFDNLFKGPA